jgi:hypothetical protein
MLLELQYAVFQSILHEQLLLLQLQQLQIALAQVIFI